RRRFGKVSSLAQARCGITSQIKQRRAGIM
ncbi:hypothetical protein BVZ79_00625B, partial [Haemophilus influenzae]